MSKVQRVQILAPIMFAQENTNTPNLQTPPRQRKIRIKEVCPECTRARDSRSKWRPMCSHNSNKLSRSRTSVLNDGTVPQTWNVSPQTPTSRPKVHSSAPLELVWEPNLTSTPSSPMQQFQEPQLPSELPQQQKQQEQVVPISNRISIEKLILHEQQKWPKDWTVHEYEKGTRITIQTSMTNIKDIDDLMSMLCLRPGSSAPFKVSKSTGDTMIVKVEDDCKQAQTMVKRTDITRRKYGIEPMISTRNVIDKLLEQNRRRFTDMLQPLTVHYTLGYDNYDEFIDHCVQVYLQCYNHNLPILDEELFREEYQVWLHRGRESSPDDTDDEFSLLLTAIVCCTARHAFICHPLHERSHPFDASMQKIDEIEASFFQRARTDIEGYFDKPNIHLLQTLLIISQYQNSGPKSLLQYGCHHVVMYTALAVRIASHLNLHQTDAPMSYNESTHTDFRQKELYRRLWWITYWIDFTCSYVGGVPSTITDVEFTVNIPSTLPSDPHSGLYIKAFVLRLEIRRIMKDLLNSVYAANDERVDLSVIVRLHNRIIEWERRIPREFGLERILGPNGGCTEDEEVIKEILAFNTEYNCLWILARQWCCPPHANPNGNLFPHTDASTMLQKASAEICARAAATVTYLLSKLDKLGACYIDVPSLCRSNGIHTLNLHGDPESRRRAIRCLSINWKIMGNSRYFAAADRSYVRILSRIEEMLASGNVDKPIEETLKEAEAEWESFGEGLWGEGICGVSGVMGRFDGLPSL